MNSAHLLNLFNETKTSYKLLINLAQVNFSVTEMTDEGDFVLHILAKSNHGTTDSFTRFLDALIKAGADVHAVDKHGKSFLEYLLDQTTPDFVLNVLEHLIKHQDIDVNRISIYGQTLFEFISTQNVFGVQSCLTRLLKHSQFDPNQTTSKHNSPLLHLLFEKAGEYAYDNYLYALARHTNPNIKNNNGQTALAKILSDTQYKDMNLVTALIEHEHFDANVLDNEENNYLQLAINSCKFQAQEIAERLIKKKINVTHKNNEGTSVFDLIQENKVNRSLFANNTLLITLLKLYPSSLLETYANGKSIMGELLKSQDYVITSEISNLIKQCINQKNGAEFIQKFIPECFKEFQQDLISSATIATLSDALTDISEVKLNSEYCLALAALSKPSTDQNRIKNNLKKLKPTFNKAIDYLKNLTQEGSEEYLQALSYVSEISFSWDNVDENTLLWEEHHLRNKTYADIHTDTKMFGHLFSLDGSIPITTTHITLTGSNFTKTAPFIVHLMNAFVSHCEKNQKHSEQLEAIRQVRNMTIKAMRYYFLSQPWQQIYPQIDLTQEELLLSLLEDSKHSGAEIITGWPEHSIDLIIKQDDYYRNNGGGCSTDYPIEHYKISKAKALTTEVIAPLYTNSDQEINKTYIQRDLNTKLGLTFIGGIGNTFQTVGNCSFYSLLLALKTKYRLFLSEERAEELFASTLTFFEQFYLEEYCTRYANSPILPHLLIRLIIQKLLPEQRLDVALQLITKYFNSEAHQEILQTALMVQRWLYAVNGQSTTRFDEQLSSLGIDLNPKLSTRLCLLERFLTDKVTAHDLETIKYWSAAEQLFQGNHLLHFAVMNNNLALASSLIKMFPHAVNHTNWFAQEPLSLAKSVEMIELLVRFGASTAKTEYDNALDYAIKANQIDRVRTLLKHGAQPSEYSCYYAATKDPKILQALMEFHPDALQKTTHDYSTPVHAAAKKGNSANIQTLVYYAGINPNASDVNGITPMQLALKHGHKETAKQLIQFPGTLFTTPHRGDSIIEMTQDNELQTLIAQKQQQKKADFEYFTQFKSNPGGLVQEAMDYLIIAIRTNNLRAIRGYLLAYPEDKVVNTSKLYCTTPFTEAIRNLVGKKGSEYGCAFEIIKMLLQMPGIDINACTGTSEPLLFWATSIDDVAVLELFLADPKLDPNKQDNIGYTALHDAVERGHLNCVRRLLQDERVDSSIVNQCQQTAADLNGFGAKRAKIEACKTEVLQHQQRLQTQQSLTL